MKIAISNIAWEPSEDDAVGALLTGRQVSAVELAPTKYWPAPCRPASDDLTRVRDAWRARGQQIVALQSLLFGQPDLSIFGAPEIKQRTAAYLETMFGIATELGARVLVFGSPRNRDKGERSFDQALEEATEFFKPLAARAADAGCILGFEPNPTHYKCNFCTTVAESLRLVEAVAHPGFRLHLDIGIMTLNAEPFAETVLAARPSLCHVHISEPELGAVGGGKVDHAGAAAALRTAGWDGFVSIEMRGAADGANPARVLAAVDAVRRNYL